MLLRNAQVAVILSALFAAWSPAAADTVMVSLQNGANGYSGTSDTYLLQNSSGPLGTADVLHCSDF